MFARTAKGKGRQMEAGVHVAECRGVGAVQERAVTEKARNRRSLTEDEAARLLAAALEGPARRANRAYKGGTVPLPAQT
jgi:hypothetical protein